jgi:hypothetical protein
VKIKDIRFNTNSRRGSGSIILCIFFIRTDRVELLLILVLIILNDAVGMWHDGLACMVHMSQTKESQQNNNVTCMLES